MTRRRWLIVALVVVLVATLFVGAQLFPTMRGAGASRRHHPTARQQKHPKLVGRGGGSKKAGRSKSGCTHAYSRVDARVFGGSGPTVYSTRLDAHWCYDGHRVSKVRYRRSYWVASWAIWDAKAWQQPAKGGNRTYRYERQTLVWAACIPHTGWCSKMLPWVSLTIRADGTSTASWWGLH